MRLITINYSQILRNIIQSELTYLDLIDQYNQAITLLEYLSKESRPQKPLNLNPVNLPKINQVSWNQNNPTSNASDQYDHQYYGRDQYTTSKRCQDLFAGE
ncbi:MAG: hypothetical protein ACMUEM_04420 [Flavobacteriales bacterium AspAUS03]